MNEFFLSKDNSTRLTVVLVSGEKTLGDCICDFLEYT